MAALGRKMSGAFKDALVSMEKIRKYGFLLRYAITGATGGVLQTFWLYVWVSLLGLRDYYLWGLVVGFCLILGAGNDQTRIRGKKKKKTRMHLHDSTCNDILEFLSPREVTASSSPVVAPKLFTIRATLAPGRTAR